jgi:hypothetical protein
MSKTQDLPAGTPGEEVLAPLPPAAQRDEIRGAIFGAKPDSTTVEFFGHKLELRQPPMGVMLEARQGPMQNSVVLMLVRYSYVPDSDIQVFTEEDMDGLAEIPFGPDVQRVLEACNKLMGIDTTALMAQVMETSKST